MARERMDFSSLSLILKNPSKGHCLASRGFTEWCQTVIPRYRFFYQHQTTMIDCFSCIPFELQHLFVAINKLRSCMLTSAILHTFWSPAFVGSVEVAINKLCSYMLTFAILHTFWSPASVGSVEVAINKLRSYMLTSAILHTFWAPAFVCSH